jgi:hypothetical protein
MAWVKRQFIAQFDWLDREGTQTSTNINLSYGISGITDGVAAVAKAQALAPLIAALSSCTMTGYRVISSYANESAAFSGEVERRGKFTFLSDYSRPYITSVPGFKDSLVDANGRDIGVRGTPKAEVAAFLDAVLDGPAGWSNGATTISGDQLVACKSAIKTHRRSLARKPRRSG